MKRILLISAFAFMLFSCTKKTGKNPQLAYSDAALVDSCLNQTHRYYKNDSQTLLAGNKGPHGTFKLRFNSIAYAALTNNGKLPDKGTMPEGAMVIKDVYDGTKLSSYAFMYKRNGNWLWGEANANKDITYSVKMDASICTSCHSQAGNRDLVVSFNFY
ncbi:MAG: hypothetical protein IT236_09440 [Bacteroidia bacterium]|nr:hypothetical protein [Bacteroidia bacterium]